MDAAETILSSDFIILAFGVVIILVFFLVIRLKKMKMNNKNLHEEKESLDTHIEQLKQIVKRYEPIINLEDEISLLEKNKVIMEDNLKQIITYYSDYEFKTDIIEMSFYQPKYDFGNYLEFSDALNVIREAQKELVRKKEVFSGYIEQKNKSISNLAVNAFNGDANTIINAVTYSNFKKQKEKLLLSFNKINNLLVAFGLEISKTYLTLKIQEMALIYDLKEQERLLKLEQDEIKEQMREEEKARREAEKARAKAIEEEKRYEKALEIARIEMENKSGAERDKLENEIRKLEESLKEALTEKERATSMAQITKKGHVYIISNIGSFGENVFKIGMTRRKEPNDRVSELSGASVPFSFDIHAMVQTDNAPQLEKALHETFNSKRMNKVNMRKEFFKVTLTDIEKACSQLGHKVKFTKLAEAQEYKQTIDLEKNKNLETVVN